MINIEQKTDKLIVSYVNEFGNIGIENINITVNDKFKWIYSQIENKNQLRSWDNKPIKKQKTKYLTKFRVSEILNSQSDEVKQKIFSKKIPKIYYIDIETESSNGVPSIESPINEIYTISIVSGNKVLVLSSKELKENQLKLVNDKLNKYFNLSFKVKFFKFEDEFEMLTNFFYDFCPKMTCMTGWNFIDFDWAYLIARSSIYNIDIKKCSPTGVLKEKKLFKKGSTKIPLHRIIIDYMTLYKNWDDSILIKESNSLDYVSEQLTGFRKIKYTGSLQDLYENDFENFVLYNIVDAVLVKLIDKKINLFVPYFFVNSYSQIEYDKVFSNITIIENILVKRYLENNKVIIEEDKEITKKTFQGGYLFPVKKGFSKYILNFDYMSLHPTTIQQFNISPETFMGVDKSFEKIFNGNNNDNIYTISGAIYDSKIGILPSALKDIFEKRQEYKKNTYEIEKQIKKLERILKYK